MPETVYGKQGLRTPLSLGNPSDLSVPEGVSGKVIMIKCAFGAHGLPTGIKLTS
jgi:hypothetical protein